MQLREHERHKDYQVFKLQKLREKKKCLNLGKQEDDTNGVTVEPTITRKNKPTDYSRWTVLGRTACKKALGCKDDNSFGKLSISIRLK